ncbi:MAG: hypothetical protein ACRD2N_08700 [Vicinamibacterales bacterium]
MRDVSRAEALLSLFTSSDRAEAIAGDLSEERSLRGSTWYWLHLFATTFALFGRAVASNPLPVLALAVLGCALVAIPAFAGVAAISVFPGLVGSPVSWLVLSLFWWGGALWTGVSLVSLAPKCGMTACLTLVVAGEALLIASWLSGLWYEGANAWSALVFASAMFASAPLLAGGAIIRRRMTT